MSQRLVWRYGRHHVRADGGCRERGPTTTGGTDGLDPTSGPYGPGADKSDTGEKRPSRTVPGTLGWLLNCHLRQTTSNPLVAGGRVENRRQDRFAPVTRTGPVTYPRSFFYAFKGVSLFTPCLVSEGKIGRGRRSWVQEPAGESSRVEGGPESLLYSDTSRKLPSPPSPTSERLSRGPFLQGSLYEGPQTRS